MLQDHAVDVRLRKLRCNGTNMVASIALPDGPDSGASHSTPVCYETRSEHELSDYFHGFLQYHQACVGMVDSVQLSHGCCCHIPSSVLFCQAVINLTFYVGNRISGASSNQPTNQQTN